MTVALEASQTDVDAAQVDENVPETASSEAQTPDAPVAKADDKYADKEVSAEASRRVLAARQAGWSRTALQEHTELTPAQLWRIEQGRIHRSEVAQLVDVLDKIDAGVLVAPVKKSGKISESQGKINAALAILRADLTRATKAELVAAIEEASQALDPAEVVEPTVDEDGRNQD